jgi:Glucosidase II beta subunit-like
MRKVWVTKESLIPKPFYKRKLFIFFVAVIFFSIIFLLYQIHFVSQLKDPSEPTVFTEKLVKHIEQQLIFEKSKEEGKRTLTLGIRLRDVDSYRKKYINQKFKCLESHQEIDFEQVNDNYCDCSDGTDETFTNACNGKFYCTKQTRHITGLFPFL